MWSFKKKSAPTVPTASRYQADPISLLFEDLILEILDQLPAERSAALQAMDLQRIFSTRAANWQDTLRETLHLSDTFDIAVWDLAIQNRPHYDATPDGYRTFAQHFSDMHRTADSKIDVWPEGALDTAKSRIAAFKKGT